MVIWSHLQKALAQRAPTSLLSSKVLLCSLLSHTCHCSQAVSSVPPQHAPCFLRPPFVCDTSTPSPAVLAVSKPCYSVSF